MPIDDVVLNFNPGSLMILNVVLATIMLGIALDTSVDDFRRALTKPKAMADPRKLLKPLYEPTEKFVQEARLRSKRDLDRASTEIFETHWAVRDAQINDKKIPGRVDPGIVQERHHALNWLLNDAGE